jgi:diguanylate cyclase (GGDEF)-like protein
MMAPSLALQKTTEMRYQGRTFFKSRLGRKIFFVFLLIAGIPLLGISLMSRQLSEYVLNKSTGQLLRDSTKSDALSIVDRVRSAESLLRILAEARVNGSPNAEAERRASVVFAHVEYSLPPAAHFGASIRVDKSTIPGGAPDVVINIWETKWGGAVEGTLSESYLWEDLDSALYSICVGGAEFAKPYCRGQARPQTKAIESERSVYFRPYLEGEPWVILAVAAPDIGDYLPIQIGTLFGYVAALALFLSLFASAAFVRRATTPLDALMRATQAVKQGDFSYAVPLLGMTDEFQELAHSFNAMSVNVGRDVLFLKVLAAIDKAILDRQPIEAIIDISLRHLSNHPELVGTRLRVTNHANGITRVHAVEGAEQVTASEVGPGVAPPSPAAADQNSLWIAKTPTCSAWLESPASVSSAGRVAAELESCGARIAVAIHSDEYERQLLSRATRDSLTNLLNRFGLVERLDALIASGEYAHRGFAVAYVDIDGFKEVNDVYGHDIGDRLLKMVAERMTMSLQTSALALARLGGDEFVFLVPCDAARLYREQISAVLRDLQRVYAVGNLQIQIGGSIGVAVHPEDGSGHDDLLKNADMAMYAAKSSGRNQVRFFESSLNGASAERIELRRDLSGALDRKEFFLVYQPRLHCREMSYGSAEALLRWRHPTRGLIPPDYFIPLAEESGLIIEIGSWVLKEAIAQLAVWKQADNFPITRLSVNLSPIQLMQEGFLATVEKILEETSVPSSAIELEVTEGAFIKDIDSAVRKLKRLQELGFAIALDDFGVGYSAMSYLSVLPFDTLKIDKSFVDGFGIQKSAFAIASAIVALAKALDKNVVAEGVETPDQASALMGLRVDELQGYLYSRPRTPADLDAFLLAFAEQPE